MRKNKTRFMALVLAVAAAVAMTACGSGGGDSTGDSAAAAGSAQNEAKEWVYVPEFVELEDENVSYYEMQLFGDALYYESYDYDEETGKSSQNICRYSLTDKSVTKTDIPLADSEMGEDGSYSGQNINAFVPLEDGGFAVVINNYKNSADTYESWINFARYDADGNELFYTDMREVMGDDQENSYVRNILTDGQGRFYLPADRKIWLIDAEGNSCGAADVSAGSYTWINSSGIGRDGKAYICYYSMEGNGGYTLAEVDFDKKAIGATYANFPGGNGSTLSAGIEKDFIVHDGTSVYEYDLASQTPEKLFDWLDSDINGSFVNALGVLEDGRLLAVIQDWSTDDNGIALLTKTPGSEVAQKEQIVIGTLGGGYDLQAMAVKFNRSNDKYHISIKQYIDYNNWTENSRSEAITNMNNDLISGNGPDIMDLSQLDVSQLAAKGVFEDLTPFLEQSSVINREDYLENILEAYIYDGKLLCIPATFSLQTVIGRASDVGTEMGWTLSELMDYADAHPDAAVFDGVTQANMLQYFMMYNEDSFIDWQEGTCHFDTEEFRQLLEFVNRFPEDYQWSEDNLSEATKIQNGEVLLSNTYISDFQDIQMYYEMFGGEITCIGYPTTDGSAGCALQAGATYAIASKSDVKDAAWSFIEYYLSTMGDSDHSYGYGFATNKKELEKMAEEAVKVEYLTDENGNQILDENGYPIPSGGISSMSFMDGWSYTYHVPTQEEVDKVLELMEVAKPVSYANEEIMNIINEEAAAYFSGQKSADEVAGIIQSRIQIFVSENS